MKKLLVVLILIASGIFILYFLNDRKEKETEAKCRAEFNKMLYEDAGTNVILNMAESPTRSVEWKSQNNLKKFQDFINAETTSCDERHKALVDFKDKVTKEVINDAHKLADEINANQ